jgi:uncharacterized protein (DUF58 family)
MAVGLGGWIISGTPLYARLVYLSAILLVGGAIWTAFSIRGVRVSREARLLRASVGEVFEERFEVVNATWPGVLWLEVVNRSPLPTISGSTSGSRLLTRISPHQRRFYTTRTLLTRRGAYPLGPTDARTGDPLGLFSAQKTVEALETLVVLPMTVPIATFPPPPGILAGGKNIHQRSMDVTPHAAGVREYVPGDPMKRIHWPTTAHRGRFMVKEFEQDPQSDIWFFLDAQRDEHVLAGGEEKSIEDENWWLRRVKVDLPKDTFEYAVSATASLARFFLNDKRAVGLACAAGKLTVLSAERGQRQVGKILETLAYLQPQGTLPMLGLVTMQAKQLPLGSGVVMVTPSVKPELLLAVEDLQRRNLRPVIILIRAETFGGSEESETMLNGLVNRDIPVCRIGFGDNLSAQLVLPAVYYQKNYRLGMSFFSRA